MSQTARRRQVTVASLTPPQIHTLAKQASHSISHTALHCEDGAEVFFDPGLWYFRWWDSGNCVFLGIGVRGNVNGSCTVGGIHQQRDFSLRFVLSSCWTMHEICFIWGCLLLYSKGNCIFLPISRTINSQIAHVACRDIYIFLWHLHICENIKTGLNDLLIVMTYICLPGYQPKISWNLSQHHDWVLDHLDIYTSTLLNMFLHLSPI